MPPDESLEPRELYNPLDGLLETLRYCWRLIPTDAEPVHKDRLEIIAEIVKRAEGGYGIDEWEDFVY